MADFKQMAKIGFQKITNMGQGDENTTVITRQENEMMRIDHDALRDFLLRPEIGDKPIAIISITGCMRTGKSFILNFFIRYFREMGWKNSDWIGKDDTGHGSNGFVWKGGSTRCTTGIRVLNELFEVPMETGGTMIVMLMDTQGLFDHQTPEVVNKTLLTLSTLACSVQIFNASRQIDAQNLQYLKTCVDFALATAEADQGATYLKLQRLMFLVRDFPENGDADESSCYGLKYGEEYLGTILNSKDGGKQQIQNRKRIKESFEDVRCFPMPHPGLIVEKKKFGGKNSELENEFLDLVRVFVEEVASPDNLIPKKTKNKKYLSARQLLNMLTACDTNFAQKIFEASNMMEANEKAYYAAEYEEAIAEYIKVMKSHFDGRTEMSRKEIDTKHKETKNHAIRKYNNAAQMGTGEYEIKYREHLKEQCDERLKLWQEQYNVRMTLEKQRKLVQVQRACAEYDRAMQELSSQGVEDEEFEKLHQQQFDKICQKYDGKVDIDALGKKVSEQHQKLLEDNKKFRNKRKEAMQEERRQTLYLLANVTLKLKCSEKWRKELELYRDDDYMQKAHSRINGEMEEEYWKEALTPVEEKYRRILDNKFENEFAKLTTPDGYPRAASRSTGMQEQKSAENELLHHARVGEIVELFRGALKINMSQGSASDLNEIKAATERFHRRLYFDFCSEHLRHYLEWLRDEVLKKAFENARNRNQENWEQLKTEIENGIKQFILEQEIQLEEIMSDRHINEEELKKHYSTAETQMKDKMPENLAKVLKNSRHASTTYVSMVGRMMKESLENMQKKNKDNMENRNVIGVNVPKKLGFFKKAWKKFKDLFTGVS